ncbi:MAG TPA: UDP-4-amino-4,6-dideoxy-N-acetyl-beta-L-altrosamine N-acetyltransferase [Campylobacterales bacterium]|nr:UDP-4-amino-4,6-dideoxy-N-acetyl-beta-L-altrosamine N-acetyltransferase [Campylobacterales bacterium]
MNLEFKNFSILSEQEQVEILDIRNLDYIREQMTTKKVITLDDHLEWLKRLLTKNDSYYFAVLLDSKIVGAVYVTDINKLNHTSYWGLYFSKKVNPLVSTFSTYYLFEYIFKDLQINTLYLEVKNSNKKALSFDKSLGFKEYNNNSEYIYMSMTSNKWDDTKDSKLFTILKHKIDKINFKIIKGK